MEVQLELVEAMGDSAEEASMCPKASPEDESSGVRLAKESAGDPGSFLVRGTVGKGVGCHHGVGLLETH